MARMRRGWPLWAVLALLPGCVSVQQMGHDLGKGLFDGAGDAKEDSLTKVLRGAGRGMTEGINENAPETARVLMKGLGDGLRQDVLTGATNEKLAATIDTAGDSAARKLEELTRVLDKLLATLGARGEQLSRGLLRGAGAGLENDILSDANQRKLDGLVGTVTGTAREQLIGIQTHDRIVAIVKDALAQATTAVDSQREKLKADLAAAEVRFRNALIGLGVFTLLAGGVIVFILWQWRRNDRLVQLLTMQISRIPDQQSYDELVGRIRNLASTAGLEPHLRKQLAKQGLLKS